MHDLPIISIDDIPGELFLLQSEASLTISPLKTSQRYVAATVIHWDGQEFDSDDAERVSKEFSALDDVVNHCFLSSEM